uniref:NHR domain-containing protein n=1 Tax=Accipiter nisus TaxID=211598 RepID=A0A8B9MQD5_9AVES
RFLLLRSVLTITEPPRFHSQAKGKNVRLDAHSRKATRRNSFCNGVTFTNRPIHLYEKVRLKLVAVHHGWSGALRFGFTIHDPSQMSSDEIPKYACPDLVTRPGYWAKALPERFAVRDNILAFWVDRHGRVFYSINDEEPILFHCGIKVSGPLWALIDVYGITHEVQILGKCVFWPVACSSGCSFHRGTITRNSTYPPLTHEHHCMSAKYRQQHRMQPAG